MSTRADKEQAALNALRALMKERWGYATAAFSETFPKRWYEAEDALRLLDESEERYYADKEYVRDSHKVNPACIAPCFAIAYENSVPSPVRATLIASLLNQHERQQKCEHDWRGVGQMCQKCGMHSIGVR